MTKSFPFAPFAVLVLAASGFSQQPERPSGSDRNVPTYAMVEILLVDAPGINDEASRWEINYKFGMATDALIFEAHKRREETLVGDLIKEGSIKQSLKSAENRKVTFQFPLNSEIQERLMNQPPMPSEAAWRQMTPEQFREHEKRAQDFTFRAIVEIYDARLQRKVFVPLGGNWPYAAFPDARFEISIQINAKGDYVVKYPRPKGGQRTEIIKADE